MTRCNLHPAFEADYCPACGTARPVGQDPAVLAAEAKAKAATEAEYVAMVRAIGYGFHPDTPGAEYDTLPEGYTPERVDAIVDRAFTVVDPYIVALAVMEGEYR